MNEKRIRFIFDDEIEEREKRGLSGFDRVKTEQIDEQYHLKRRMKIYICGRGI